METDYGSGCSSSNRTLTNKNNNLKFQKKRVSSLKTSDRIKLCRLVQKSDKNKEYALYVGIENKSVYRGIPVTEIKGNGYGKEIYTKQ